jgi:hypothetical protein
MKNLVITFLRVYILLCQKGQIWQDIPDSAMTGLNSCESDWIRIHNTVCHTLYEKQRRKLLWLLSNYVQEFSLWHVQPELLLNKQLACAAQTFRSNCQFEYRISY